jgi:hypothetical protein
VGDPITFVRLDVHKATIAVCVAEAGRDGEVRFVGEIPNEPVALDKLAARLGRARSDVLWHRHTGEWHRVAERLSLTEALHRVASEPYFQPC